MGLCPFYLQLFNPSLYRALQPRRHLAIDVSIDVSIDVICDAFAIFRRRKNADLFDLVRKLLNSCQEMGSNLATRRLLSII